MKHFIFCCGILLFCLSSFAQQASITGKVRNSAEDKPIQNAVVSLFTPRDSLLYTFTRTDSTGSYQLKDVADGKYILMISHPYYADILSDINVNATEDLGNTNLVSKSQLLQEVIVKTGSPLRIKGDTTIYTADSFKVSANANVEELLKKLPGIQVDKDGKIKAMGETVQKVLVDGEEFFGDDPGMAVKNLRADAVKEVQVFDKKSDQAEFTGIEDGKTQKTINLKLKENKKTGYFGKIDLAAGPQQHIENRYNNNLLFSTFKGKRKLSGFLVNGNTGQDGPSWEDERKYGGNDDVSLDITDDGDVSFTWTGSSDNEPYVDPENGFTTNLNAGVQYSNKWNDKYNLNFSPRYNNQKYTNNKIIFRKTQIGDSVLNYNSNESSNVNRQNYKFRTILDMKIDSSNSLKITANNNFYHTESDGLTNSQTTGNTGDFKNTSQRQLQTKNDKNALNGNIVFKHKFKKLRRTLTFSGNYYTLNNKGLTLLKSNNEAYFNGIPSSNQDINQQKDYEQSTKNISAAFVYTEPLTKTLSLQLGYQFAYNYGTNNQITKEFTNSTGKYDEQVDSLSNEFKQNIFQNIPSAKINFANKKLKLNAGSSFGFTQFDLQDITYNKDYKRSYINFYPTVNGTYTYKPNRSIRFNYTGSTTQPTVNQLQPLRNNTDYFNQVIGNPDLRPSFTNSFNISHQNYNFLKDIWMYQSVYVRFVQNAITTNSVINLDSGKTVSQPINVNGNYYANFYGGFGFKIKKIDTRIQFSPN
ncbi:MAG: TonB-dependent receptor, partial [Ginsengibacter sp.]